MGADFTLSLVGKLDKGGHARRVMRSYEDYLRGQPEADIIHSWVQQAKELKRALHF